MSQPQWVVGAVLPIWPGYLQSWETSYDITRSSKKAGSQVREGSGDRARQTDEMMGNSDPECVKHNQYTIKGQFRCHEAKLEKVKRPAVSSIFYFVTCKWTIFMIIIGWLTQIQTINTEIVSYSTHIYWIYYGTVTVCPMSYQYSTSHWNIYSTWVIRILGIILGQFLIWSIDRL